MKQQKKLLLKKIKVKTSLTVNKKSAKSLLPPLSRKASLLDGQKGNANTVLSTSMLNSTQPFSSQYNSNTSSNTTFIQQNQGEFSNTDKNSQQSSYFSKFRSTQEVNQEDNSNIAHSQSLVKKVSFCDQIKKMNTQTNKATNIQNSFLEQMQIDTINEMKKNDKNNNLNKSKEELILLYDSKDQQKPQQNNDYESNNYHLLSLNDNRSEMQKQNIDNQSVIFEKSIEIYDSNENLQEISAQNEFENSYFESNIKNLQMPNLEQQDFNQIINQDQQNLNQNSYLEISPQKEQKQQKENLNSSSPKLGSSEFSLNNNNQNENSCQYQHQLEDNNCQSMKKSIQKSQYTQNDEKQEFDKKEISNFLNNSFQMNQIYNQNNEQQEEEESIKKQSQIQFKGQANLDYCYNSNQSIDYMTKSVQFYDSEENSIQNNRSDFVENNQNGLQQNITFEQYFQILSQKQNIQQENGQLTLTFSKNNDSTNQCIDLKNHRGTFNKNEQSQKSICQNFLVGIPQDCVHSHYDIQEQKQVRNDFSAKLKQIVQHKQLQFHNQKQQSQTEKIDQKTIVSENQIIDSNITTDPSYSYQQFKLQNQNQQQKMLTSNITNENRFSFCNNASFNDNLHLQNQSQKSYYYNNIEQEDQIKQIQGRKINQQELNNDFENKENNSLKNKFDKTQQNQKAKSQQQKVKIVQIDLLKELSQNNLKFDQDFQEKDNVYVPQIFYNENSQYRHQDHNQLSQNLYLLLQIKSQKIEF
ncbi:hypothetical protein TTHERM_00058510 (macronuclear) [Tetrahymena thermophila SB210]|uniref:Uncharacterized protein n=1 Tax=Tetrahymena thermophila (strain SB210) TaxID=312017 RepID=I7MH87_TETTS|nr:hypothetical protein TTHERM_00058510 [Tetrahymena thermophila SB210]EAR87339.2 hypothetical protein TTHERM_00058510 [Tetrahymena thermophila SB210]|eukprot:XP_001007584.2 hypothetical protein TTHERM_00058510 [Tetrahymena thermophila SB210]